MNESPVNPVSKQNFKARIKWFDMQRGYGFIERNLLPDLFVHISQLRGASAGERKLSQGDQVSFQIGRNDRGECAINVRVNLAAPAPIPKPLA